METRSPALCELSGLTCLLLSVVPPVTVTSSDMAYRPVLSQNFEGATLRISSTLPLSMQHPPFQKPPLGSSLGKPTRLRVRPRGTSPPFICPPPLCCLPSVSENRCLIYSIQFFQLCDRRKVNPVPVILSWPKEVKIVFHIILINLY